MSDDERRLSAIIFTDIVGYTSLAQRDESLALQLLEKLKRVPDSVRTKGSLIAFVYAGLNDLDECFRWLEYAVSPVRFSSDGSGGINSLKTYEEMRGLRPC